MATLRLATWNVNSLRLRLEQLARFSAAYAPDVVCLQEIKMPSERFPRAALEAIRKWRYNPKIEGGKAVERKQRFKFIFDLGRGR